MSDVTRLFFGSAFIAVGFMVAAVAFLRRRPDPLMISLAMFALLFGIRFWLPSALVAMALPSVGFREMGLVIDYLVPMPALWFFVKAGYFGKSGQIFSLCLAILLVCLVVITLVAQPKPFFHRIYDIAMVVSSFVAMAAFFLRKANTHGFQLVRGALFVLCGNTRGQFITAVYVYLDAATSEMLYSAAAHPAMLLLRRGEVSEVVENGLMLAAFEFANYTTANRSLEAGDRILLYTDGLIEAENADGMQFGMNRLCAALQATVGRSEEETADQILRAVERWSPVQDDDRTLVVCDCLRATSPDQNRPKESAVLPIL